MRLRTRLVLAFLLLAVLPLVAIVSWSYYSSIRSLRELVKDENTAIAMEIAGRIGQAREGVSRRLDRLGELPVSRLVDESRSEAEREQLLGEIRLTLGEMAPYVEALEIVPSAPDAPAAETGGVPAAAPEPAASPAPGAGGQLVVWLDRVSEALREARLEVDDESAGEAELVAAFLSEVSDATGDIGVRIAQGAERLAELRRRQAMEEGRAAPLPPPSAPPPGQQVHRQMEEARRLVERRSALEREEVELLEERERETRLILGGPFDRAIEEGGVEVARLEARISAERLLRGVLSMSRRDRGEIPYAVDRSGNLFVADEEDRGRIEDLPLADAWRVDAIGERPGDWALARTDDPESGLTFGIARPIREPIRELRRTAGRNFALGLGLVGLALIGIVPLSGRITRDLGRLTAGARRLGAGELDARVPVRSRDEIGELAGTFNQMAAELAANQARLVEQERVQKEHEIERRLLAAENERKTAELEEARRFQLSLLPGKLPELPGLELAALMKTATEVGGDYYDFRPGDDGALTVGIGDATGHGARAGTMVTVIKSLFIAHAHGPDLTSFLSEAAGAIHRMELGRMAMAFALARLERGELTVASAGMPPVLIHRRRSGAVEELAVEGVPLGAMAGAVYRQRRARLEAGDTALLMSDGLPELPNAGGEPFGYDRVQTAFEEAAAEPPEACIARLVAAAEAWTAGRPPADDITLVVLRVEADG